MTITQAQARGRQPEPDQRRRRRRQRTSTRATASSPITQAGAYNNLTVSKVKVTDVYLRGIYASSGGTFDFNHDTVENVQAEEASIAIFAFGGSGRDGETRSQTPTTRSRPTTRRVRSSSTTRSRKSGSGVHTDNNGDSGGTADVIEGNNISLQLERLRDLRVRPVPVADGEANKVKGLLHRPGRVRLGRVRTGRDVLRKQGRRDGRQHDRPGRHVRRLRDDRPSWASNSQM